MHASILNVIQNQLTRTVSKVIEAVDADDGRSEIVHPGRISNFQWQPGAFDREVESEFGRWLVADFTCTNRGYEIKGTARIASNGDVEVCDSALVNEAAHPAATGVSGLGVHLHRRLYAERCAEADSALSYQMTLHARQPIAHQPHAGASARRNDPGHVLN